MKIRCLFALVLAFSACGPKLAPNTARRAAAPAPSSFRATLQAQLDSATGTVYLPMAGQPYVIDGPIFVDSDNISIEGWYGKPRLTAAGGYFGPLLVFGMRQQVADWTPYRPDSKGVLDSSVPPGLRGIDTQTSANLLIQCHPLQYGGMSPTFGGNCPSYWSETPKVTFEFLLARPPGVTWTPGQNLFGMRDAGERIKPWVWTVGDSADSIRFAYVTSDLVSPGERGKGVRKIDLPIPGNGPWRVTFQLDLAAGKTQAWVNARRVEAKVNDAVDAGHPFGPGLSFAAHEGTVPLLVGGANQFPGGGTRLQLFGLRMTAGLVYQDVPVETFAGIYNNWVVNDKSRYFSTISHAPSGLREIGYFPLSDPPGRTVELSGWGRGVAFWVVDGAARPTSGNAVRNLRLEGSGQALVTLGMVLDFEASAVETLGAMQGIGSLSVGANYPITLDRCKLRGSDAAYFGVWQIVRARATDIAQCGREGIRLQGGSVSWQDCLVAFVGPNTETIVSVTGDAYGGAVRLQGWDIDTEGSSVKRAFVEHVAGNSPEQTLVIDGLTIGSCQGAALLRLVGTPGIPAANVAELEVKRLRSYGLPRVQTEVVGGGWKGTVNGQPLPTGPQPTRKQRQN